MKLKMTRVVGGKALRTDSVEGEGDWPVVGKPFHLVGEGLEFGSRLVVTSPVRVIGTREGARIIYTQSGSVYTVEEVK